MDAFRFITDIFHFSGVDFIQALFEFFSMMSHFSFGVGYLEADDRKYDVAGLGEVLVSILFIHPLQSLSIFLQESLPLFVGGGRKEVLFEFREVIVHFAAYPA